MKHYQQPTRAAFLSHLSLTPFSQLFYVLCLCEGGVGWGGGGLGGVETLTVVVVGSKNATVASFFSIITLKSVYFLFQTTFDSSALIFWIYCLLFLFLFL